MLNFVEVAGLALVYYLLILIGTVLEGELTLIAAAVAVNKEILHPVPVVAAAWVGSFLGDWFFFMLGRRQGPALMTRFPRLKPRLDAVAGLLERMPVAAVFIFRFQIAMRMAACFTLGNGRIETRRYLMLNLAACLLWAVVITWICVLFTRYIVVIWSQLGL